MPLNLFPWPLDVVSGGGPFSGSLPPMRLAVPLLAILLLIGWVACTFPEPSGGAPDRPDGSFSWRRTVDGWELSDWWQMESPVELPVEPPVPHPGIVALWQILMAAAIGVATLPDYR